jgi:hypothetical protein
MAKKTPAKAKAKPKAKTPEQELCRCGCGETLNPGRRFKMGHDARYHGRLKKLADGRLKPEELAALVKPYALPFYKGAAH